MEAGEAAMRSGHYADAERIFSMAVRKAEQFSLHDRRVAVTLSRLAQAYTAQEKYVEAEPVYLQALQIYQDVHGEDHVRCRSDFKQPRSPASKAWPVCRCSSASSARAEDQREDLRAG